MKKRIFSILLAALMVVSVLPATAWATDHTNHDEKSWTSITSLSNETVTGSYYLESDVELSDDWVIGNGDGTSSAAIDLCLNGMVLNLGGHHIVVNTGSALNLYDCGSSTRYFTLNADSPWTQNTSATEEETCAATALSEVTANTAAGTLVKVTGGVITGGNNTANHYGGAVIVNGTFNMNGGNIVGNTACDGNGNGAGVYVNGGATFTMGGGNIAGNKASQGGGVYVDVILGGGPKGTFTMNNGMICGNVGDGGGVCGSGDFTMNNGTIRGNKAPYKGGGVCSLGTFTMSGGTITANKANSLGGGVCVDYNTTFTMSGGNITDNAAGMSGGGVCINSGATFTMSGGSITGNTASGSFSNGGGVYNDGTFTMNGGTIDGNKSNVHGGGVFSYGTFTMNSGSIIANKAENLGGGVYHAPTTIHFFTMNGGNVTGNEAACGGGVFVGGNGTAKLSGGVITKNVAALSDDTNKTVCGGGVYVEETSASYTACVILGGSIQITDNVQEESWNGTYTTVASNLYLSEDQTIQLGNGSGNNGVVVPADGMQVGVTKEEHGTFTNNTVATATDVKYFFADDTDYYVSHEANALKLAEVENNTILNVTQGKVFTLYDAINNACNGDTLKFLDNVTGNVSISGKEITLDLNGHVFKGIEGSVITINSSAVLTLIDSNPTAEHTGDYAELPVGGVITGGTASNSYGGAVCVGSEENPYTPSGTFTMNGGTICGCQATSTEYDSTNSRLGRGGAIYIYANGTFNMNGGAIKDCSASVAGGAIFNIGKVNITGGKITDCFVSGMEDSSVIKAKGGAVYNYGGSQFTMTGGEISGNTLGDVADQRGAGVYVAQNANVTLGGIAKITGNTKFDGTANNLFLYNNTTVTIGTGAQAPAAGMVIGVTTYATPGNDGLAITTNNGEAATMYFHSDNDAYTTVYSGTGGSGVMKLIPLTVLADYVADTTKVVNVESKKAYSSVSDAITDSTHDNYYIRLLGNITENIDISSSAVTLDLNGHVLSGNGESQSPSVITVSSSKTLTLIDTDPTAVHKFDDDNVFAGLWTWNDDAGTSHTVLGGCITGGKGGKQTSSGRCGSGVSVTGNNTKFNMYGGNIVGNFVSAYGGGVYVADNGAFELHGGSIVGNFVYIADGGGVFVQGGTFTMTDGSIVKNTSLGCGGGVRFSYGTFTMTGGDITGNTASGDGGGVDAGSSITLGGTAKITGNTANGATDDLCLPDDDYTFVAINTETRPTDGFSVGVVSPVPTAEKPRVAFASNGIATEKYGFFSDKGHKTVFEPAHLEFAYIGGGSNPDPAPITPSYGGDSTPTYTVPVSGDKTSVKIQATISGSNATIRNVTSEEIETVGTGANIVVDLSGVSKSVTAVTIPKTTFENVAASDADGLEVDFPNGTVAVFNQKAVQAVKEQASGNEIKLVVDRERKAEQSMTSAQKEALKTLNKPVALDAYFVSGNKRISDFKGGEAKLTVGYQTATPVRVWYITEEGSKELIPSTYDGKTVSFVVTHFSHYVIELLDGSTYSACPQDETCVYAHFVDADPKAWYHSGVHFCVENKYMVGVAEHTFKPSGALSRGMIVTMLWRMEGEPVVNYAMTFKDVETDEWYAEAIRWAQSTKVVEGYDEKRFGPKDNVTREQLATILYRYAQSKGQGFTGSWMFLLDFVDRTKISSWADEAVHWCSMKDIVNGKDGKVFDPQGNATRAEAACMVQRFYEKVLK